jgi:novobiocin biosynthesis protein NovU/D-mycarose 3-C-methyltransferase
VTDATPRTCCRICDGTDLAPYLDLGGQPLANAYPVRPGVTGPRYPLAVVRCRSCAHSQLSVVVDPDAMFTEYLWVSGTTETQRRHFAELAGEAAARVAAARARPASVLDIGCNDGTLLDAFRRLGFATYGVDPAVNLRAVSAAKGHRVRVERWTPAAADALRAARGPVDLVTGCNVLAHCDDVAGFLEGCRRVLAGRGHVVLEFPYARVTLEQQQFDQVYHEHLSYFLVSPFRHLCDRQGWSIVAVTETPIHGGSIRFTLRPSDAGRHVDGVGVLEGEERAAGFLDDAWYDGFSARLQARHRRLSSLIEACATEERKLVAYGASAKGNTMLNWWRDVAPAYVVDDNPLKCGRYTPGRSIPIVPGETLRAEPGPLAILLTAWNFADEIRTRLRTLGRRGDRLLAYLPAVGMDTLA